MARKSRKTVATVETASSEVKGYKTALYVRLSREDERKIESETVENQVELLKDYIGKEPSLVLVDEYVDRHVTGTKFDRPEFNRMIADIRGGRINCVVECTPKLGKVLMETALKLKSGEAVLDVIHPEEQVFSDEQDTSKIAPRGY